MCSDVGVAQGDGTAGPSLHETRVFLPLLNSALNLAWRRRCGSASEGANDVRYGLTGYISTRDVARAHRVARDLEAGMIWINAENVRHLPTPLGGMKASGIGL